MSNNHSIQILRGTRAQVYDNNSTKLNKGQPLYITGTDANYLVIGSSDDSDLTQLPIIVREVHGYSADNSSLARSVTSGTNDWHFGHDGSSSVEVAVNGFALNLKSTKNVNITSSTNVVIKDGNGDNGKITLTKDGSIEIKRSNSTITLTATDITENASNGSYTAKGGTSSLAIAKNGNITATVASTAIATVKSDGIDLNDSTDSGRKFIGTASAADQVWVDNGSGTTTKHSVVVTNALPASPASNTIYFIY